MSPPTRKLTSHGQICVLISCRLTAQCVAPTLSLDAGAARRSCDVGNDRPCAVLRSFLTSLSPDSLTISTLLAVVPRVFAGLPLICEQSPGDRAKPHIGGGRAPNRASADRVRRASEHRMRDA